MKKAFYVPRRHGIIDLVIERNGVLVGEISGETLEQMRVHWPDVIIDDLDSIENKQQISLMTSPVEIDKDTFVGALNLLPPNKWITRGNEESFKMAEHLLGMITTIYARLDERYFAFNDLCSLPHEVIMIRVRNVLDPF